MTIFRSLIFQILFYLWTLVSCVFTLPVLLGPYKWIAFVAHVWLKGSLFLLRVCCNLRFEVRGWENLPKGPFFIASKHQSMWDTMVFHMLVGNPAFVLKRELLRIPVYGWYLRGHKMIAIDREGGGGALKKMVAEARRYAHSGRTIVIFPEGTRTAPGQSHPYHSGVGLLYSSLDIPVVPVALNSGLFWGRLKFIKNPGVITLEALPVIEPGMDRRAFTKLLQEQIESASERLRHEALARFPHLRKDLKPSADKMA